MDSLTQPETTTTARDVGVALIALLDRIEDDPAPECALLRDEVFWSVRGKSRELSGRYYAYGTQQHGGLRLLELWRQKFGGEVQPTAEQHGSNSVVYALKTQIDGHPVALKVPVEQPDVEQQLRDRIAELEAALDRGTEGGEAQ